ncbi:hypothetical protein [Kitasatospora sp. NPDC093558]|uniref:hypothetical protein n=1 Tax=Kitasatospora sp. NPDC093558 TaxID=3155201 RepID=UPI0034169BB5
MDHAIGLFLVVVGNDAREWSSIGPSNDGSGLLVSYQPKWTRRIVPAGSTTAAYEERVETIVGCLCTPRSNRW